MGIMERAKSAPDHRIEPMLWPSQSAMVRVRRSKTLFAVSLGTAATVGFSCRYPIENECMRAIVDDVFDVPRDSTSASALAAFAVRVETANTSAASKPPKTYRAIVPAFAIGVRTVVLSPTPSVPGGVTTPFGERRNHRVGVVNVPGIKGALCNSMAFIILISGG